MGISDSLLISFNKITNSSYLMQFLNFFNSFNMSMKNK